MPVELEHVVRLVKSSVTKSSIPLCRRSKWIIRAKCEIVGSLHPRKLPADVARVHVCECVALDHHEIAKPKLVIAVPERPLPGRGDRAVLRRSDELTHRHDRRTRGCIAFDPSRAQTEFRPGDDLEIPRRVVAEAFPTHAEIISNSLITRH